MRDLGQLIKAYDIRGTVPDQFNESTAWEIGAAFALLTGAETIVTVRDMRPSSVTLAAAFAGGATSQGANIIDAGLGSTDLMYFASGHLGVPGAVFTASHNPAEYNGIKLCRSGAAPVGQDTGLADIRRMLEGGIPTSAGPSGTVTHLDLLAEYAAHLRGLVDLSGIRPLKIVVDAGNGMAGHVVPAVLGDAILPGLPLSIVPMYFDLDGTFPNHEANPIDPANLVDLQKAVVQHRADAGLAFDGDADRCFLVDENGEPVPPSAIVGLIATRELARDPGAAVVYNVITSQAVSEIIAESGGVPVRCRVGHSFMKQLMAEHDAVFGGEHSGHYYFRDFWRADTGMLAAMHVLAALGGQDRPLSELAGQFTRYTASGEINSQVADTAATLDRVASRYADRPGAALDRLDGLTVTLGKTWFNLRPSNTEPMLRLNVEAPDTASMVRLRDEVLATVRETDG
ncbi:phosphomannomutase/phosphoglucomutase [Plantactinospora sp. KLBMP9567]|uniref:phosphomannomutase/phosphoglucomutase n=1 Tax=Plantactinospora sp. KLBMP9567 TaxID=3085900 RepID=UPI002982597A|nr:phosphomannomutase/phosphoglucomutase [Plantactinospora sp. KLBMP9567]MDW5324254.1 phosphomannomutase/phosphoglucomutase [Plantactinospora sp. KLBMP9567]